MLKFGTAFASLLFPLAVGCDGGLVDTGPEDDTPAPKVGQTEQAVVGGTPTSQYAAVPQLGVVGSEGEGSNCSGSLISPRVVLTAAHCLDGNVAQAGVVFGPNTGNNLAIENIPVEDFLNHPSWTGSVSNGADVALVLLERDSVVEPIPFNETPLNGGHSGQTITWVGWGITGTGNNDAGTKRINSGPVDAIYQTLVGYGNSNGTTCSGDSGGPGFMNIGGQERVVSITSFHQGSACGQGTGNSFGTRTDVYSTFINDFIRTRDIPIPPTVNITAPNDGATVGQEVRVSIDATDNTRVERVEIYVDGSLASTLPLEPYSDVLSGLPVGPANIEVRAYDNRGDVTSEQISVTVDLGGGIGVACDSNADCGTGICGELGGEKLCTADCTMDSECPDSFECRGAPAGACWPVGGGGGGCQAGGSNAGTFGLLLLLGLAFTTRRRSGVASRRRR